MKNTAESVKQALNDAGKAQAAAEKAIQKARNDIGSTQNRLAQVKLLQNLGFCLFFLNEPLHNRFAKDPIRDHRTGERS